MNFNYGNNNFNLSHNFYMNNSNHPSNSNISQNIGINNYNINNPMNMLLQYANILNSNILSNSHHNTNNYKSSINNTNMNLINTGNIFQLMPNIIKFGFNPPYSLSNTKKEPKIIHPSNFRNKLHYKNNNNYSNNDDINDNDNSNERKFMRKMTKAEKIEIDKWFEARKKLYPTKKNIELKKQLGEIKVEKGLVSNLELKLRKKVNILKKLNSSKKIKIRNDFNKAFPNFQKRKKEMLELNNNEKDIDKNINNEINNNLNIDNNNKIDNILEEGEIIDEIKSNNENKEIKKNLIGRKRRNNIKKKFSKNKKTEKENKENGFKKGFKYKINNLYDELIKKEKIKEQNILLQAIRYLINLKEE